MHIYIYIYTYIHIYIYIYTIHIYIYIYTCTYAHAYTRTCMHTLDRGGVRGDGGVLGDDDASLARSWDEGT